MADRSSNPASDQTSSAIERNIEAIVKLEESFIKNRTAAGRIADWIADFSGSLKFIAIHVLLYGSWILINTVKRGWLPRFDPFPFLLLSVVVSLEAIFLSTFVLIKQNRVSKRSGQRGRLDLQINLLAEREMTLMLQMLHTISARVGDKRSERTDRGVRRGDLGGSGGGGTAHEIARRVRSVKRYAETQRRCGCIFTAGGNGICCCFSSS
jgi:uncharacterized membrane protein